MKEMEINLENQDDSFLRHYKMYIDSIFEFDKHQENQGFKYFMEQWMTYLDKLNKEEREKLIDNQDYLSYTLQKFLEHDKFINTIYRKEFSVSFYTTLESLWSEEKKDLFDSIRDSLEKAIYNSHGLSINRLIRNTNDYIDREVYFHDLDKLYGDNPYCDMIETEEEVNLNYSDGTHIRRYINGEYLDIFGFLETFDKSENERVGVKYKKLLMENKMKNK
jgi:hypothetical protein